MKTKLLFIYFFLATFSFSQDKLAYQIYTKEGKKTTYAKMIKATKGKKAVFFGELHDNPIAHWLELEVLKELHNQHKENLVCGSEMFEHDNQRALDNFMNGVFTDKQFADSCRLWPNHSTDYAPMLEYAKTQKIAWVATNIPRKYASLVYKKGIKSLDSLSSTEKSWISPLPYPRDTTLSQYKALLDGEMHMGKNFVFAQMIKDATMGYFISQNMKENTVFYHVNGSYHSDFHQGILWYLNYYNKMEYTKMLTIATVTQEQMDHLDKEFIGKANFIVCIPESMTRTH